jgi:hypothetical protein
MAILAFMNQDFLSIVLINLAYWSHQTLTGVLPITYSNVYMKRKKAKWAMIAVFCTPSDQTHTFAAVNTFKAFILGKHDYLISVEPAIIKVS